VNILLTTEKTTPDFIQSLILRGILPPSDKSTRADVADAKAPLIAARVKGHDVYIQSEADLIPSVKHSAKRVFIIDGEVIPGQNITMYTAKVAEGEDVYDLLMKKGMEQMDALGAG